MAITIRDSLGIKLLIIISVALGLIIPVFMIRGLVDERQDRAQEAQRSVQQQWGGPLTLAGPVLSVPFRQQILGDDGKMMSVNRIARILPKTLDIKVQANPQNRTLGIFSVPVYTSSWNLTGTFAPPELPKSAMEGSQIFWDQAVISLELRDFKTLTGPGSFLWEGKELPLKIQEIPPVFFGSQTLGALVNSAGWAGEKRFSLNLDIRGSDNISVIPLGDSTAFSLKSSWTSPLFTGGLLPENYEVSTKGFTAIWKSFSTARGLPSVFIDEDSTRRRDVPVTQGVDFTSGVDNYLQSDRALKYGFLFIILPFALLFLLEVFTASRFHPLQYLMIGLADVIFYLILVALGEHMDFNLAFFFGAAASSALIIFYTAGITIKPSQGWIMAPLLGGLYLFLFAALQSEDYALLIGTIGLFFIVAAIMILTRKVDWFRPKRKENEN